MRSIFAISALVATSAAAPAAQLELLPVDDTQIVYGVGFYAAEPDTNYGAATAMSASTSRIAFDWDRVARSLIKFDLSPLSLSDTVTSVTLQLTAEAYNNSSFELQLHHLTDDAWQEDTATWNNAPSLVGSSQLGSKRWTSGDPINWTSWTIPSAGAWDWRPDITDGYVTLMLKILDDTTAVPNRGVGWITKEGALASAPRLVIEYSVVPLPAAAWLLAASLVTLAGAGGRRRVADADQA